MGRAVNLVVSCTSRKSFDAVPGLAIRELPVSDMRTRLRIWKERLKAAGDQNCRADNLYIGDHWSIARAIPKKASACGWNVRLWICSAGYGLIQPDATLKSYQATFSPGTRDHVLCGVEDEKTLSDWWAGVCTFKCAEWENFPRSLSELADSYPRTPMVVVLSADYLRAIENDLKAVLERSYFKEFLSIVSCGTPDDHHLWQNNLLPCDARMSPSLGGTLTSLNVRIARFLFRCSSERGASIEDFTKRIRAIGRSQNVLPERNPQTDQDIASFIETSLRKRPGTSKTKLLREFRESGKACEQKRFGKLYSRVWREVQPKVYA